MSSHAIHKTCEPCVWQKRSKCTSVYVPNPDRKWAVLLNPNYGLHVADVWDCDHWLTVRYPTKKRERVSCDASTADAKTTTAPAASRGAPNNSGDSSP